MGTVNLPTPVVVAIGALCVLAGYLLGVVAGPDRAERTVGTVESFDADTNVLCLAGDDVAALDEAADDEVADEAADDDLLCGRWERSVGSQRPGAGDQFRFVVVRTTDAPEGEADEEPDAGAGRVLIYGAVVD